MINFNERFQCENIKVFEKNAETTMACENVLNYQ